MYLSLVDLDFNPSLPPTEMLTVRVTCSNRDQASRLRFPANSASSRPKARPVARPLSSQATQAARPPLRRGLEWRLISHLSLNHLSIVEQGQRSAAGDSAAVRFFGRSAIRKQIAGIVDVTSRSSVSRVPSDTGVAFCRGTDVTIRVRRRPVRRHRRVPAGLGAAAVSGAVQRGEFVQPVDRENQERSVEAVAAPGRRTDPSLEDALFDRGYEFDFFQAVRLLGRLFPNRKAVGGDAPSPRRRSRVLEPGFPWHSRRAPSTISNTFPIQTIRCT